MDKVLYSPLKYWGGKHWLFKKVWELIPEGETEIFSPFLGGGSIEINLAYRGYTVHAYDNYAPLVNFWQHWLSDPESVRLKATEILSVYTPDELNIIRCNPEKWFATDIELSAFSFIHYQFSYNSMCGKILDYGLHIKGDYIKTPNPKNFGVGKLISNWKFWQSNPIQNLNVNYADFDQAFSVHIHQFAYVDPPYFGNEKGYGGSRENGFNHEKLRALLAKRGKWVLSYNDHPEAHGLYEGYRKKIIQRSRLSSDGKPELLIFSHDVIEKQLTLF